jgi:hypothetical protein
MAMYRGADSFAGTNTKDRTFDDGIDPGGVESGMHVIHERVRGVGGDRRGVDRARRQRPGEGPGRQCQQRERRQLQERAAMHDPLSAPTVTRSNSPPTEHPDVADEMSRMCLRLPQAGRRRLCDLDATKWPLSVSDGFDGFTRIGPTECHCPAIVTGHRDTPSIAADREAPAIRR